jgi:hypothetical protein
MSQKRKTFRLQFTSGKKQNSNREYYVWLLTASEQNLPNWATHTEWIGFTPGSPKYEIRIPSIILPDRFTRFFEDQGFPYLIVNQRAELDAFLILGGYALIEKNIIRRYLPELLKPSTCTQNGTLGFAGLECFSHGELQRAPTPKVRMKVLTRDAKRCCICGRRPADYIDVELHIHHILPWASGGVTNLSNLITLCHTCHRGLEPHFSPELFGLLPNVESSADRLQNLYVSGVASYRSYVAARFKSLFMDVVEYSGPKT